MMIRWRVLKRLHTRHDSLFWPYCRYWDCKMKSMIIFYRYLDRSSNNAFHRNLKLGILVLSLYLSLWQIISTEVDISRVILDLLSCMHLQFKIPVLAHLPHQGLCNVSPGLPRTLFPSWTGLRSFAAWRHPVQIHSATWSLLLQCTIVRPTLSTLYNKAWLFSLFHVFVNDVLFLNLPWVEHLEWKVWLLRRIRKSSRLSK